MRQSALAVGGTLALAALIRRSVRSNELFLDYLLNTVVNKIPLPDVRLALTERRECESVARATS